MLAELLQRLSEIEGIKWIRIHYAFPTGFPMEIIDVMKKNKKICNYLDNPLQHGSSKMLKIMRRGTNRKKSEELIHKIRDIIPLSPNLSLSFIQNTNFLSSLISYFISYSVNLFVTKLN